MGSAASAATSDNESSSKLSREQLKNLKAKFRRAAGQNSGKSGGTASAAAAHLLQQQDDTIESLCKLPELAGNPLIEHIFAALDTDGNGRLSFEEFKRAAGV